MQSPLASSFLLFGFNIKYYSLIIFCALIFAFFCSVFLIKKYYIKRIELEFFYDLFPILILFGIIGARLYYVLLSLPYFIKNPLDIFAIWNGGISIQGGIITSVVFGFLYSKYKKQNPLVVADAIIPALPLAQAIGRWGNYFNQEAFGTPTNLPWGLYIEPKFRPLEYMNFEYFHPTFLYESILNFILFLLLFFLVKKYNQKSRGQIFFSYFVFYSIIRFFIEGLRVDSVLNIFTIPVAQIACAIMFLLGILGIVWVLKNDRL